jgi:hypothetical protein
MLHGDAVAFGHIPRRVSSRLTALDQRDHCAGALVPDRPSAHARPHHLIAPKFLPLCINVEHWTRPAIGLEAHSIRVVYRVNDSRNTTAGRLPVREPQRHDLITLSIFAAQWGRGDMQVSGKLYPDDGKVMVWV